MKSNLCNITSLPVQRQRPRGDEVVNPMCITRIVWAVFLTKNLKRLMYTTMFSICAWKRKGKIRTFWSLRRKKAKLQEIGVGNTQIENINFLKRQEWKFTNTLVVCREGKGTIAGMIVRESVSQLNLIVKPCVIWFKRGILKLLSHMWLFTMHRQSWVKVREMQLWTALGYLCINHEITGMSCASSLCNEISKIHGVFR
jgi:hypothetical protein